MLADDQVQGCRLVEAVVGGDGDPDGAEHDPGFVGVLLLPVERLVAGVGGLHGWLLDVFFFLFLVDHIDVHSKTIKWFIYGLLGLITLDYI